MAAATDVQSIWQSYQTSKLCCHVHYYYLYVTSTRHEAQVSLVVDMAACIVVDPVARDSRGPFSSSEQRGTPRR